MLIIIYYSNLPSFFSGYPIYLDKGRFFNGNAIFSKTNFFKLNPIYFSSLCFKRYNRLKCTNSSYSNLKTNMSTIELSIRERFRELFENDFLIVLAYNLNGIILDANYNFLESFGYNPEEVINKAFKDFILKEDFAQSVEIIKVLKETGTIKKVNTYRVRKKDGSYIFLEVFGIPLIKERKIYAVLAIGHDVSKLKISEKKLRDSETKYRNLFESSTFSIVLIDLDGTIKDVNSTTENFLGYNREDVIGKNFLNFPLYSPEMIPFLKERLKLYARGDKLKQIELKLFKKDGSVVWVNPFVSLVDIDGKAHIQIIFNDVTSRIEAERKLKMSETKYKEAYERENFYKDLFTHDTRNILQSMLGSLELCEINAESIEKNEELKNILKLFKEQVYRGANLVKNVRTFTELTESEITLKSVDAKLVLNNAVKLIEHYKEKNKINITIECQSDTCFVQANDFLIDVFENILINSIIHNQSQIIEIIVKIYKSTDNRNHVLNFEFIDNGAGIPEYKKEIIFTRFKKESNSVSGMGFGLSLVKTILDKYNAKIKVKSKVKDDHTKGSIFLITFPISN